MEERQEVYYLDTKKSWKSYTWEFVMLFLAVFCGFIANYQLSNVIDRDKEKQYMQSLVEDLAADTTNLSIVLKDFRQELARFDTVAAMYDDLAVRFNDTLLSNISSINGYYEFINTDRTFQQLKNSGEMRLIIKRSSAKAIMDYDSKMKHLMTMAQPLVESVYTNQFAPLFSELVDMRAMEKDMKISRKTMEQLRRANRVYLLKKDVASLGRFYNCLHTFKQVCGNLVDEEEKIKKQAAQLIVLLKKDYDLQ